MTATPPAQGLVDAIVRGIDWTPTILVEARPDESPGQARERCEREAIVRMILGWAVNAAVPRPPREVALAQAYAEIGPITSHEARAAFMRRAEALHAWLTQDEPGVRLVRTCRGCGCTDVRACTTGGRPCHWVTENLCSACAGDVRDA